ncbi:branched-chain amino acid aminotransferase [Sodalinema gerasimenkoae]|uniref:branched-chain amino acid aminotransferase n=1 Tax=Sodalinema gerasimenkoae TaxID=2862348 RepID=UPI001356F488|nr:branched-chain amino acid aminotransferase [Sodalinema gerasimenkoae]
MAAQTYPIEIKPVSESRLRGLDINNVPFGRLFSDHMLVATYEDGTWNPATILPYGKLEMSPSISALHYGQAVFEGMKAYKGPAGEALLFRPQANFERINRSAARLCMPPIPEEIFLDGLRELIRLDANWIPTRPGSALYIRPIYFATDESIGLRPSQQYTLAIICCPVGAYYAEPVKLTVTREYVRAFPGGTGAAKAAGNYAASLLADRQAKQQGYDNVLWLDGVDQTYIEECGTMNVFFVIDGVVVTPPLGGTILPGITRDSIITLLKEQGVPVEERRVALTEILAAHKQGRLQEAFGAGTAATIAQIETIAIDGVELNLEVTGEQQYGARLLKHLDEIKTGKREDHYGWMMQV